VHEAKYIEFRMCENQPKKPKEETTLISLSDIDYNHISQRQKLKQDFIEESKLELKNHIIDLQKNLAINKTIISELVSGNQRLSKTVILLLNEENSNLQTQLKRIISQRDQYQAKLLMVEQLVNEYKRKELVMERQMKSKEEELKDQLNKKEYLLQAYDHKVRKAAIMLSKYSVLDCEIKQFAKDFNVGSIEEKKISNLLDENIALSTEVRHTKSRMVELERKLTEIVKSGVSEKSFEGWKYIEPMKLLSRKNKSVERSKAAHLKPDIGSIIRENNMLKSKKAQLIEEVQLLKKKLQEYKKKNEDLVILISEMKKELNTQETTKIHKESDDNFNNPKKEIEEESFGALSTIRAKDVKDFLENN